MHPAVRMTGGSSAPGMTSLLSREREIKEHEKLLVELEEKIAIMAAASSGARPSVRRSSSAARRRLRRFGRRRSMFPSRRSAFAR